MYSKYIKIKCCECGKEFRFTEEEQKWYEAHRFTPPKRCRYCRKNKNERRNINNGK